MKRSWFLGRLAATLLILVAGAAGAQPAPPPPELFFAPDGIVDAQLSPTGRFVSITTAAGSDRVGLFVWDLDKPGDVKVAARFSDVDIRRVAWLDDDRLLFDVHDLSQGGAEQKAPGLFVVRRNGDELRTLVAREGMPFIGAATSLRTPPLGPNHRLLGVPAGGGNEVIVGELRGHRNELEEVVLRRLDVTSGRTRSLSHGAPAGVVSWLLDSRGEPRVATVRRGGRVEMHWRGPSDTEWRRIAEGDLLRMPFTPHHVDDRGQLYVMHNVGSEGTAVLSRFEFERGRPAESPFVVTPGFDYSGRLITEPESGRVLGVRVETDAESTVWLDKGLERVQALIDQRLPGLVNRLSCRRCGQDDRVVLVRAYSARDPGHLWLYRAAAEGAGRGDLRLIGRVRQGVDPTRMAGVEFHRIRARDGRDLPVWLTVPPGRKIGDKGPAVVMVHGGPWVRGGHWRWDPMAQFLASRGWLVVAPEFRGSAGYGQAHLRAGDKQFGRAMQDDVADAALWARQQGWADRFCIAGASYGGYSTLMGLINDPQLYRCGVAWVGIADLFLYLEGSVWTVDDISESGRRYSLPQMVGDSEQDAERLRAVSPVIQAQRIEGPLLLAYGENDLRVPVTHGERLRRAMRAAGREPEWVTYPGEGHSWLKTATHLDFARRVEAFLRKHLD